MQLYCPTPKAEIFGRVEPFDHKYEYGAVPPETETEISPSLEKDDVGFIIDEDMKIESGSYKTIVSV